MVVVSIAACGSDRHPAAVPVVTSPSPSVRVLAEPADPQIVARLVGRTGHWRASLGLPGDQGDLTVRYRCTGGGELVVGTDLGGETAKATSICDGVTRLHGAGSPEKSWPVAVTVEPDGAQRWSLVVVRGPYEPGDDWPKGAPEIDPGPGW
ncbi:hypothetical protein GCM10010112_78160 [Actinoplanes lobatus]|uniref:Uncharacterized protein n=1 Tax=Actinoplanes lobatus TaxID=113568 RepID=A0A7W7HMZ3_9ACTN|nr:hypothetical protein [Actinoplanes lobatus]MBB4753516.1 hypothetical protein [Actinoplanes lobatus]GGN91716.1 hypothetical protein GCM10010112_78160 [Actinoplanes lobatus]